MVFYQIVFQISWQYQEKVQTQVKLLSILFTITVPGVPGFGNKDAGNIIGTYGSLQEILKKAENADANPKLKA
jgi:hypothetical protein